MSVVSLSNIIFFDSTTGKCEPLSYKQYEELNKIAEGFVTKNKAQHIDTGSGKTFKLILKNADRKQFEFHEKVDGLNWRNQPTTTYKPKTVAALCLTQYFTKARANPPVQQLERTSTFAETTMSKKTSETFKPTFPETATATVAPPPNIVVSSSASQEPTRPVPVALPTTPSSSHNPASRQSSVFNTAQPVMMVGMLSNSNSDTELQVKLLKRRSQIEQ